MTEEKPDLLLMYKTSSSGLTTEKIIQEFDCFALVFDFHGHQAALTSNHPLVRQLKDSGGTVCHYGSGLPGYCREDLLTFPHPESDLSHSQVSKTGQHL